MALENRLAGELSPYLLQHADNPVAWQPWGEEAFAHAREQGLSAEAADEYFSTVQRNAGRAGGIDEVVDHRQLMNVAVRLWTTTATLLASLDVDFNQVGFEYHPLNDRTYGCSSDAILYEIDVTTGMTSQIGPVPQPNGCSNLGAPWTPVACLE